MKALDEYFPMLVFTLLVNRVHVFANAMFDLKRETSERVKDSVTAWETGPE